MAETSGSSASGRSVPVPLTSSSEGGTRGAAAPGAGSSGSGSSSRDGCGAPLHRSRGRPATFPYPTLGSRALEGLLQGTGSGVPPRHHQTVQVLRPPSCRGSKRPWSHGGSPSQLRLNKLCDKKSQKGSTGCTAWSRENMPRCTSWRPRCTLHTI